MRKVVFGVVLGLVTLTLPAAVRAEEVPSRRGLLPGADLLPAPTPLFHPTLSGTGALRPGPTPVRTVEPPGSYALAIDGSMRLGGSVFKDGYPFLHNDGGAAYVNTALGLNALINATPGDPTSGSGSRNTAVGASALLSNTTGSRNTATGAFALYSNATGSSNTATGFAALYFSGGSFNTANGVYSLTDISSGTSNAAFGSLTLQNSTSGSFNTAIGGSAMAYTLTGSNNTALGYGAGLLNFSGSNNVWISAFGADESNTMRIGSGTGSGSFQQNRAFISGIRGVTTGEPDALTVVIDSDGQLGTVSSSRRFKEGIRDMAGTSEGLAALRPVTFHYRGESEHDGNPRQYGLIAEEVAVVFPELVAYDEEGRPEAVLYRHLTPMLLNELQTAQRQLAEERHRNELQARALREIRARLSQLEQIAEVRSAGLDSE